MTYANGAPHPGDGRAYSDGGLVGHDVQVDLERRHQQLKLLRELEDAARRNQQQQPRPVYSRHPTPVPRLSVGPVIWNAVTTAPASSSSSSSSVSVSSSAASAIAGRAPVLQTTKQHEQQQRRRFAAASAGHVAPSIHTILEIARSSSGSHGQPSSSMPLTNTSRYYSKNPDQQHRQRPSASSEVRGGSSSSAGVIPGPRRPAHKAPEERDQVSRQQKGSSIPTASASGVAPSPPPQQQPVGTVGTFGGSGTTTTATTTEWSTPLRRGKWTKAEEEFAAATIRYFCGGLLNLQFGTLLRGFLAQQLHCHPMRISKKLLPGTTFCGVEISRKLGRRAYSPRWCDSPLATQQKLDAEDHLVELRAKFIASIEEEAAADSDELGEETRELCRAAERLSETSESRASTGTASAAGSPPSDVKSETTRAGSPAVLQQQQRYHHHQQASQQQQPQMYQYNQQQQQQVVGQKRTRGDNEWAAAEQAQPPRTHQHHHQQQQQVHHHNQHQPQHPMHHQHQHSLYIPSQATNQRWGASPPVRSGPPQIWHSSSPSPPRTPPLPSAALAGAHAPTQPTSYYESVPRPAKLPRLHHHQQQQQTQHQQYHQQVSENVHEPQRSSAPSPPSTLPLLPSLRASLQRASTYQDQQQQQQQGHQQHPHQQHRL